MRYLPAVALAVACLAFPAHAQRGGGGHGGFAGGGHAAGGGGFHGGFSGGSGAVVRGGFRNSGTGFRGGASGYGNGVRPGVSSAYRLRSPGIAGARTGPYTSRGYRAPLSAARPAFYNRGSASPSGRYRGGNRYPYRGNRFGYGYGYPGFYGASLVYDPFLFDPLWGFGDPFWNSDGPYGPDASLGYDSYGSQGQAAAPDVGQAYSGGPPDGYGQDPRGGYAQDSRGGYAQDPGRGYAPSPENEPGPWAPQVYRPSASTSSTPLRQEKAVTIVFKDGRPPEQVRNYALTRSALLVAGAQMREIPLDEVDLPATERVNRAAGVDFRLPQAY